MAPSPAAGKNSNPPKTPTKTGKNPASKRTPKLDQSNGADEAKNSAKGATDTPTRKPPKLGASKATPKQGGDSDSPKLPPRPKQGDSAPKDVKDKADDAESEADNKIGLDDNDPPEETPGKVSQAGNETGAESSVADDLEEAAPEPEEEDDDDTVGGAKETAEGEEDDAEDEAEEATGGITGTAKSLAGKASSTAGNAYNATKKGAKGASEGSASKAVQGVKHGASGKPDGGEAGDDTAEGAKETAEGDEDDVEDEADNATGGAADKAGKAAQGAKEGAEDTAEDAKDTAEDAADDAQDTAEDVGDEAADQAPEGAKDAVDGAKDTAEDAGGEAKETAEDTAEDAQDTAEDTAEDAQDTAEDTAEDAQDTAEDTAEDAQATAKDTAEGAQDTAEDAADGAEDTAEDAADGAEDTAEDAAEDTGLDEYMPDVSILKGLEVGEGGEILGQDGEALGQLDEGSADDLAGQTVGENGEILDEDGDVIGRVSILPDKAKELAQQAKDQADQAAKDAEDAAEGVKEEVPDIGVLDGLEVGEGGEILNDEGVAVGKIVEGDPEDFIGQKINAEGEVLDEDGDVIGRAEALPQKVEEQADGIQEKLDEVIDQLKPTASIFEGKKLTKKGTIIDDEGEVIGKLAEGYDPKKCAGKVPDENGEIHDDDGELIGKVEVVEGEAADDAMKSLNPELVEKLEQLENGEQEGEEGEGEEGAPDGLQLPEISILDGYKVNKKGEVLNEDGDVIARLLEGELSEVAGKKINDKGQVVDKDGNVVGSVELVPEAAEALGEMAKEQGMEVPGAPDLSVLDGLKVNKKGEVLNEDGEPIARLVDGELSDVAGKKLNDQGEILDKDGNVIGKVELIPQATDEAEEAAEDAGPELPSLSVLEGLKCNKSGIIVDDDGKPVGKLVEGDAKKLAKSGVQCDDKGQFWDSKGNVIGRAETTMPEDDEEEGAFAGLEGLIVVKDGWVEDENGNRVGQLVEGDAKKLVGRAVDDDGDVIDKRGNVVGHAERYEEPEEVEPGPMDLSSLTGLTCNKQGNVIGSEGVPIARLVEGNAKELAGKKIDGEGQIWNDAGKVVGRCEMIPEDQREAKPEGAFGGLEGLVVVKDGLVEDEEGNVVGKIVEGDPKRLVGRAVDEDGDIVDKYGNVKGKAEPYEIPEEEEEVVDLSVLAGKTVNKQGNVVDEHGTVFGRISSGDPSKLAGRKVDGDGNIWSDDGKVIGKAELIPGGEQTKPDGPFSGFESVTVGKEGMVQDAATNIVGRVIEGDAKQLQGRKVDDDGDILDKQGNAIGKAERWEPEEKERSINPMSGRKVNKEGEVRDEDGNVIGYLTEGDLKTLIGKEIDDNGYVIDNDGNRVGGCTLVENMPDEEEGPSEEELKKMEDSEVAKKMSTILSQTLERMEPVCKNITDLMEKADRTPKEELDEEKLVNDVKPLLEEGNRILQECNGAIRGLDPDGHIAANAKARAASGEASPEEHRVAEQLKELTTTVVKTIDNAKKKVQDMPHAKKKLSPLWALLTEPLFQIIAAVGLLLAGVLGLVGKLLNGLGLGGLVSGLLGGLGVDKLLGGLGLGSITESMGLGGGKKKK